MRGGGLGTDIVILTCAISAGIHGALAREHFGESTAAGLGFVAAAVLLAVLALVLTRRPAGAYALVGAALVLGGLLVSYALAVSAGVPVLHPEPEPVDGLALATKAIESVGLWTAGLLARTTPGIKRHRPIPVALTTLVAVFSALAALAAANGHHMGAT